MPDTGLILYEFPCSEKIRFYLRLEALKQRLDWFLTLDGKAAHQAAINALFDLSDVAARSDLKNELLKALLQQRRDIEALPANATVDGQPAKTVLALVSEAANSVSAAVGRTSQILRDNEWLQLIRNRQRLPGGTCEFDLPQLHYWLSQPAEIRRQELLSLAQTLLPITNAAHSFSTICGRRPSFLMLLPSTGQCRFPHQAVPINSHASGCLRKVNAFLT